MSESTHTPSAPTDTVASTDTVVALPQIAVPAIETRPANPFLGRVYKVTPSTIDPSSHVRVWRDVADQVGAQGPVVLDVSDIAEMDRRAVTAMVQCFKKLERNKLQFCICGAQRQVEAMLELLGVLQLVESFPTVEGARATFQPEA